MTISLSRLCVNSLNIRYKRQLQQAEQYTITDLADEIRVFSRNDVLVNIGDAPKVDLDATSYSFKIQPDQTINRIAKTARQLFKENGAHVFCLSEALLKWEWKGKICASPILLCPANISFNKIKQEYQVDFNQEDAFVNPFLLVEFQKQFDYIWPQLPFLDTNWEHVANEMNSLGFTIEIFDDFHYGNFHHHRYNVLRDVEYLENLTDYSTPLNQILNVSEDRKSKDLKLTDKNLFAADIDQSSVFSELKTKNLVVQGPPGTGKSQVIGNILGKLLYGQYSTIVVSEKRVALDVLKVKLSEFDLDKYCFLPEYNSATHEFIQQLKSTWLFLESNDQKPPFQLNLSREKKSALQFKLDVISKKDLIGGIGFTTFQNLCDKYDLSNVRFNIRSAQIQSFIENKEFISKSFETKSFVLFKYLPFRLFEKDHFEQSIRNIENIENRYSALKEKFELENGSDLLLLMKKAAFAQIISNENQKDYFPILKPNSADRKKFNRLSKKYFVLRKEVQLLAEEKKNWKVEPTKLETSSLISLLEEANFIQKFKLKKRLHQLLKSKQISFAPALVNWLEYLTKKEQYHLVEKELLEIGVSTETEIDWLKNITPKINEEDWQSWSLQNKKENKKLADSNAALNSFYNDLKNHVKLDEELSFPSFFDSFNKNISLLITQRENLVSLSESLYNQMALHTSIEELEKEILKSNWLQFVGQYPSFENFNWTNLSVYLDEIIAIQKQESADFAAEIVSMIKAKFEALLTLINTSNRKLSEEDKERKSKLKKGRSILVKEFAKTRSHPTIRELLISPAKEWIECLLPIWMVNPSQVAEFFPIEKEQFDIVLFDEATQIPFVNSLGALYRSRRTLIVGDEQQMTPTSFFKSGESEPIDLLHQGRFTWNKVMLKHHYRSQHPDLIYFSNKHFYNNELIAFPSATSNQEVMKWHPIKNAKFVNRENIEEAKAIALFLETALAKNESLGIVAFSETQLSCIYSHLSTESRQILEERIDDNTCFFRALENIQGDECDHLVVSLGYAPNEEDKLLLNFGPLNRKSGRRRLNVLLSRSKKQLDFFSSIQSSDLALSSNDSLNLLRQFLHQLENKKVVDPFAFPYELEVQMEESNSGTTRLAKIHRITEKITDVNELITLHQVLSERGWEIQYL